MRCRLASSKEKVRTAGTSSSVSEFPVWTGCVGGAAAAGAAWAGVFALALFVLFAGAFGAVVRFLLPVFSVTSTTFSSVSIVPFPVATTVALRVAERVIGIVKFNGGRACSEKESLSRLDAALAATRMCM